MGFLVLIPFVFFLFAYIFSFFFLFIFIFSICLFWGGILLLFAFVDFFVLVGGAHFIVLHLCILGHVGVGRFER